LKRNQHNKKVTINLKIFGKTANQINTLESWCISYLWKNSPNVSSNIRGRPKLTSKQLSRKAVTEKCLTSEFTVIDSIIQELTKLGRIFIGTRKQQFQLTNDSYVPAGAEARYVGASPLP